MNIIRNLPKKAKTATAAVIVLCAIAGATFVLKSNAAKTEDPAIDTTTYTYTTETERRLAESVTEYLARYVILEPTANHAIADSAVENYNKILSSGITSVNSDHTEALAKNIRHTLEEYFTEGQTTEEDLSALSAGISKIICDALLSRIEENTETYSPELEEQYLALTQSLQEQIDELKKKSTSINIRAKVTDNGKAEADEAALSPLLGKLKEETLDSAYADLQKTKDDILHEISGEMAAMKQQISGEMDTKYGNVQNGKNGSDGKSGADGKNGSDGKNGLDGKNGQDGLDGADGKTTYLAYAEDVYGTGFSLTPTEDTKYIGSCLSASSIQPTDPVLYGNWSLYKSNGGQDGKDGTDGKTTYTAYAEDADGNGFSLTPTETTRYIGYCLSASTTQPTDSGLYGNWQEYRTYIISTTTDENNVTTLHIR